MCGRVTAPQYEALQLLAQQPQISSAVRARLLGLTRQTRYPDLDGRVHRAELTELGRRTLERARHSVGRVESVLLRGLAPEDVTPLLGMLSRCALNLSLGP